jgi:hypothetical protein
MDNPTYIKSGFDPAELLVISKDLRQIPDTPEWVLCDFKQPNIHNSELPDLSKRPYLSPWGRPAEEFTYNTGGNGQQSPFIHGQAAQCSRDNTKNLFSRHRGKPGNIF